MRKTRVTVFLLVVFSLASPRVGAEDRSLLVSGVFADSSIIGPALRFTTGDAAADEYALTLLGGTLEGQWVRHRSTRHAWILTADVTPFNAHLSDRIYVDGERAHDLEYEAASHRIRGGLRFTPTANSTTDFQIVGLLEEVEELDDARVRKFWEGPFAGIDIAHTWKKVSQESPLIAAFTGILINARVEAFTGPETWSRAAVSVRSGFQMGRVHLRQSLLAAGGSGFNVVNRMLVGGSWDVLGETALYGHRYGEYRVARALLANAGADYTLPRNWRVGVRGSYLHSDVANVHGTALNVSKIWKTFGFNAGVGKGSSDPVVYFAVIAPLYAK